MTDLDYIRLTLDLAAQGEGLASPNPLVGSIVVRDGEVVGRGFHRYEELKHAEAWALEEAGERARGATVYVNLEPCAHQGSGKRTAPCVRALIDAGVKRVVASMVDPNPRVNGLGFEQLRAAGIEVTTGLLESEARRLNEVFIKSVSAGAPFVHLKVASSLDGRIATRTGESKWITGPAARAASQALRHRYDAILVGIGTVLADDPLLTDRTTLPRRRPLARVVLDTRLRISPDAQLVRTAREWPTIVVTAAEPAPALLAAGVEIVRVPLAAGRLDLRSALAELGRRDLSGVLVEGGAEVAGAFVAERLVDKYTFFLAPRVIGGRDAHPSIGARGFDRLHDAIELRDLIVARHGEDWEFTGYPG